MILYLDTSALLKLYVREAGSTALLRVELGADVLRSAGDLAEIYSLRGFDSIHLASALWLKARISESVDFAVFDQRLRAGSCVQGRPVGRAVKDFAGCYTVFGTIGDPVPDCGGAHCRASAGDD